jgi:hypothetical protein
MTKKKEPPKQKELFSRFHDMSLLDLSKEMGKIRRSVYAKQVAYEKSQQKVQIQSATEVNDAKS